jgi:5-(carboxyamino)imidazole ribonucleotide synthase
MKTTFIQKKLGVLGGGQLGKMLMNVTKKWSIETYILDPNPNCPASKCCDFFFKGDFNNYQDVYNFGKKVDIITIEIEHVNVKALYKLEKEGIDVYPSPSNIELIQNKGVQKDFFKKNKIPTSDYIRFDNKKMLSTYISKVESRYPFIWKSERMGYDGKGVKLVQSLSDLEEINENSCLIEDVVDIKHELAVLVARNNSGNSKSFPVLEMEFNQKSNQVEYVILPSRISEKIKLKSLEIADLVSKSLNHVGLIAVELFCTNNDDVLVNEIAPRVHNSGHLTIESCITSQFEQHIRAIYDLPLGNVNQILPGVMVNLVGENEHYGEATYHNIDKAFETDGVYPHIYGKKTTKPNRKMGHITIVDEKLENAISKATILKNTIKIISTE